jgi:hypothetical protein
MKTTEIRKKLTEYIHVADEKKVKAIYTMLQNEIEEGDNIWTDEFLQELDKRTNEYENGRLKLNSWKAVKNSVSAGSSLANHSI